MTEFSDTGKPYIGEVRMFAGNSQPVGWAFCDGSILNINDYPALYGVIGTTYGGDGVNNFALPDLRGRVPMGHGAGPGLLNRVLGQQVGAESVALTVSNLPAHNHVVQGTNTTGNASSPGGNLLAASGVNTYTAVGAAPVNMGAPTGNTGSGSPHHNIQPSAVLNFIIALQGRDPRGNEVAVIPNSLIASS